MLKSSLALAIFSAALTINIVSPAFAAPRPIFSQGIQLNQRFGVSSETDDWCGTRVPGIPPRPHHLSDSILQNRGISTIVNSRLSSTRVANPGVIRGLNPQPLPPRVCRNITK